MSVRVFFDTNVLIYALAQNDPRSIAAEQLLLKGGVVSVQVLNEFVSVARRKLALSWPEVMAALSSIRTLCGEPIQIDVMVHESAVDLAHRHGLAIYDSLTVAAAAAARCDLLLTEEMQHGRVFDSRLRIENPFRP